MADGKTLRTTHFVNDSRKVRDLLATFAAQMAERDRERGKQIQALRKRAGHRSAESAAQVAGVSHRTFQNWESGGEIKEENRAGLAKALKITRAQVSAMFPEPVFEVPDPFADSHRNGATDNLLIALEAKLDQAIGDLTATQVAQAAQQAQLLETVQQLQQQIEVLAKRRKSQPGS